MGKQIIVEVSAEGEITIKAVGFKGSSCQKATAALERALGKVTKDTKTPEFFQQEQQAQSLGH
jgi:hypothetical protein